jgi:hypothetical protein
MVHRRVVHVPFNGPPWASSEWQRAASELERAAELAKEPR